MTIKRRTPLPRQSPKRAREQGRTFSTIVGPRTPVKKRNAKRQAKNFARAYGADYADWIRSLPCCACGIEGFSEAAHTRTGGTSRKADASTLVPLCGPYVQPTQHQFGGMVLVRMEGCHRASHRGIRSFEKSHRIDLKAIAADLWASWSRRSHPGSAE